MKFVYNPKNMRHKSETDFRDYLEDFKEDVKQIEELNPRLRFEGYWFNYDKNSIMFVVVVKGFVPFKTWILLPDMARWYGCGTYKHYFMAWTVDVLLLREREARKANIFDEWWLHNMTIYSIIASFITCIMM